MNKKHLLQAACAAAISANAAAAQDIADEIIVTGTSIRGDQFQAVTPVDVFDRSEIDATGFSTVTDLFRNIPVNIGSEANRFVFRQNNTLGTAQVNLRGLGLGATLVLTNGRRNVLSATFADDGSQFVDINQIPLGVIDRVEVVKTGSSAIYGSDAVAGVVNFITRSDFEGVELSGQYQTTTEASQEDVTVNFLAGWGNDTTHLTLAATYFDRSDLAFTDRDFTGQGTEIEIATGRPGSFILLAPPMNPAFAGTPTGAPVRDPGCVDAGGLPVDTPGGEFCGVDTRDQFSLVPDEERISVYADLRHSFSDAIEAFVEFGFADSEATAPNRPPSLPGAGASGSIIIPPTNPFNPFGAPVVYIGRPLGTEVGFVEDRSESTTFRVAAGLGVELSDKWRADVSYVYGRNRFDLTFNDLLVSEFFMPGTTAVVPEYNAFATAITDPALANDPAFVDRVTTPVPFEFDSDLHVADASVSGELFDLPAGPVGFAGGFQYRRNEASLDASELVNSPGNVVFIFPVDDFGPATVDAYAGYAELAAPLHERVNLQVALRYENYGDGIGDTLDPKAAITVDITDDLVLRGSVGTSFRAPTPLQIGGQTTQTAPIVNPCTGQRVATSILTNGNADLEPEDATTYSAGLAYDRGGSRASIDYWRYDYDNVITRQSAEALAAGASCVQVAPGVFVPAADGLTINPATGQIFQIAVDFVNAGSIKTDGIDFNLGHTFDLDRFGALEFDFSGTLITTFDVQETPGAPVIDRLDSRNVTSFTRSTPNLRFNNRVGWSRDGHQLTAIVRYIDDYTDDLNNDARVDSYTTLDLQYAYTFGDGAFGLGRETRFQVGAINVTDEQPPFVNDRGGFDPLVHDPRGRLFYVGLTQQF